MSSELERRIYLNRVRRREEAATHGRPVFVESLAASTGVRLADEDFLRVEAGDRLTAEAFARRMALQPDITWTEGTEAHIAQTLDQLADAVGEHAAYLVGHASVDTAGVPRVPAAALLRNVFDLWDQRAADFCLVTAEAEDGCFLEWDCCNGYELTTWGRFAEALTRGGRKP